MHTEPGVRGRTLKAGSLLVSAGLVLAISACDGGSSAESWGSGSDYSVAGALAQLPAAGADEELMIFTGDLLVASERSGLERPTELDGEAVANWLLRLTGVPDENSEYAPAFVPLASSLSYNSPTQVAEVDAELGWSVLDADAFVSLETPPNLFSVVAGDLEDDELNPDLPEVADGVVTAGEGEDLRTNLDAVTAARPLGMPLRMAQRGDQIAASPITDDVVQWLAGPEETLADDQALASVADALDAADPQSAVLVAGGSMALADALGNPSEAALLAAQEELGPLLPADPFEACGVAWTADDGATLVTFAFAFASDEAAEAAAPAFEQMFSEAELLRTSNPVSDFLLLSGTEVDGSVVRLSVNLAGDTPVSVPLSLLVEGDLPFVHQ